jgi:hypothetical protein
MFSVGQKVWHRDGQRSGTVLEIAGGRVYIEQDNGVELDFREADVMAAPAGGGPVAAARPKDGRGPAGPGTKAVPNRTLTAADITPEHKRVLSLVPVRTVQAVAAIFERRPGAGKFSALGVAEKLNVITEITAVPYRIMHEYADRPGEMGLMMGKGLADSRKGF